MLFAGEIALHDSGNRASQSAAQPHVGDRAFVQRIRRVVLGSNKSALSASSRNQILCPASRWFMAV